MEYVVVKQPRMIVRNRTHMAAKRILDLSICLISLPFIAPIFLVCGLAIWLDSRGPILFIQDRIGKGGRHFRMIKFRTMQPNRVDNDCESFMKAYVRGEINCDGNGRDDFKPSISQRVTRVGRWLRKASLDELPQIINVIKGEMSIVGPRPNVPWEVQEYRPWHYERLEVLPGITGLAQVRGRSCIDFVSLVRFDIQYIETQCLALDLKILWWTAKAILNGKGAR